MLKPTRLKQLIKTINDCGLLLEAAQRVILQALGMGALVYEVLRAMWR